MADRNSTKPALIPAVSYIRMSSDKQEDSPEQQRAEIAKLAERGGYLLLREYLDESISGDCTEKRVAFLKMRDDCQQGDFRVVLCWDQDRFGRFDPIEGGYWIRPFRQAGVTLHTVAQGIINWEDFQSRLLWFVQQEGKHAYLRDLSRNVVRGQLAGAAQGLWQGGPAPYGYQIVDQRIVVDPDTAPVVRRIFKMLLDGKSTREIASELNAEGIPGPYGGTWRFSRVCKLVKKRIYMGEYRYGDNPEGRYHWANADGVQAGANTRKGRHWRFETNPLVIPHNHEALVSEADFERCQQILRDRTLNKSPYRPKGQPYRLAGILKCGHCGGSMVGVKKTYPGSDGPTNRTYVCANYQQSGNSVCKRHFIGEDVFTPILIRKLKEHFQDVGNERELRAEIRRQCQPKPLASGADVARLQARIEKLNQQIDHGAEKLLTAPADLTTILTAKLQTWQKERDALQRQLQAHQSPQDATVAAVEEIIDGAISELQTLRERLHEADPGLLREVLRQFVAKVELWFDFKKTKYGTRVQAVPRRGLIHLREDLKIIKLVPADSAPGTCLTIPITAADFRRAA